MNYLVTNYIDHLRKQLNRLPSEDRDVICEEISSHITDKVAEYTKNGLSDKTAVQKALAQFTPPEKLAEQYLNEFELSSDFNISPSILLLGSGTSGLAILAIPIFKQTFDWAMFSVGVIALFVGLLTALLKSDWTKKEMSLLRFQPKAVFFIHLPTSIFLFWLGIKISEHFARFSVYYLFGYWILLLGWLLFMRRAERKVD